MTKPTRKIVKIDETRCNGCGECVPACAEGAIRIIDGKARLVAENLCDGIGNCLGTCPMDAITIEERPAEDFDEQAVRRHLSEERKAMNESPAPAGCSGGGCPGSMLKRLRDLDGKESPDTKADVSGEGTSRLGQWPVQLSLLPTEAPMWDRADVLLAADCVAFAMGDFHNRLLAGKTLAIACPKLDQAEAYVEKLARIFACNDIRSLSIARMEVPCCSGLTRIVRDALARAGRHDLEPREIVVSLQGQALEPPTG